MRAPKKLLCLQWVKKAWDSVTTEVIINSFKVCGISVDDSSEHSLTHCIKPGAVAADATAEISTVTATLLDDNEDDLDTDPFPEIWRTMKTL